MRQPHTFLLTIMLNEDAPSVMHGRVRLTMTDREHLFAGVEELVRIVLAEINFYEHQSGALFAESDLPGSKDEQEALLTTDQRGRPRTVDGDDNGNARCDMGAFGYQP